MTDIWTSGNKSQFPSLSHANTHHKSITASLQGDSERSKGLQCRCRTAQSPSSPNQLGDSLAHKFPRGVPSPPQHTPRYPRETMVSAGNSGADEAFPTSETRPRGDPAMPYCCAPSVHCHLRRGRRLQECTIATTGRRSFCLWGRARLCCPQATNERSPPHETHPSCQLHWVFRRL